jgi:L-aspartate oxidase
VAHDATTDAASADVIVVGAGAAGLYTALVAAREGAHVVLVSRSPLAESASYWAQGGIAAALAENDSPERHLEDTLAAGRGAVRESAARVLCEDAPARVRDLEGLGVRFDADRRGALALGLEGGHSERRVVHAGGSATGRRITRDLSALAARHPLIDVMERTTASVLWVDEGRCTGVLAQPVNAEPRPLLARATVLATGGAAALWARTTNPRGATGVGMTLASAAGAELADLEFMQFHPTALVHPDERHDGFLITEAVRGEGATLVTAGSGERFVNELAPRDEVALAIQRRLRDGDTVLLDMRRIDLARFPNIVSALEAAGIDPAREPVPVAPAAHYTMGGVATDLEGRASLPGLYAVGECGCNGLHGANRLASNSLAECFVFGHRAALAAAGEPPAAAGAAPPSAEESPSPTPPPPTRRSLWRFAGLEREGAGLSELADDPFPLARLIARSALAREESRGAHQRSDHPETDPARDGRHLVAGSEHAPRWQLWR